MVRKRIQLAQNFLTSRTLVERLVSHSSIRETDIVYEIGPGDGVITKELAKKAAKVIAIEIDPEYAEKLRVQFQNQTNVEIHVADFLDYQITYPKYKVFSNIPFNITSEIVRKLLHSSNPPVDSYLIMQKEAADKFAGIQHETEFSILTKPWFNFIINWNFRRTDFFPIPAVDVVLLQITKHVSPLVSQENSGLYKRFIKHGFGAWKKDLKTAYKDIFTYEQWKRLAKDNGFHLKATPTQLSFEQWLKLFEFYLIGVPSTKKYNIP